MEDVVVTILCSEADYTLIGSSMGKLLTKSCFDIFCGHYLDFYCDILHAIKFEIDLVVQKGNTRSLHSSGMKFIDTTQCELSCC